jgi:glycosyltransferase involved in cell wall biosynthesis
VPQEDHIAYIVSRFPIDSETFVVREMNALVDRHPDVSIELLSLFPATKPFLHPSAERWMALLHRPTTAEAALGTAYWLVRKPIRLLGALATVVRRCARSPRTLARSLATVPLAAAHARRLAGTEVHRVHAHFAAYPTLAAWVIRRLTGIPYSFTAHAYDLFVDQSMLADKVAEAEDVVAISEFNRSFLGPFGGGSATPVEVVHCGVDPASRPFADHPIPAEGPVRALCVASLEEKKGHRYLLAALASGGPGVGRLRVELVGDGPLRWEIEAQIEQLGLGDRVRVLGSLDEGGVRERLAASDLFVLPSVVGSDGQMEGLPVALMESLAAGVTTVATRLSGIPELIRDGETGYLAEPADAESLASALERAVSERDIDPRAGRRLIEEEFDVNDSADRMYELLRSRG